MKKVNVLVVLLVMVLGLSANATVLYNDCSSMDDFVVYAPDQGGIETNSQWSGTDSDSAYLFTVAGGWHEIDWFLPETFHLSPGDEGFSFDIRNDMGLGTATFTLWVFHSGGVWTPINNYVLGTNDWEHIVVPAPLNTGIDIQSMAFLVAENSKYLYLDNLTLTNSVPEPATMALLLAGGLMFFRRKK